jgi:hypothetical protein
MDFRVSCKFICFDLCLIFAALPYFFIVRKTFLVRSRSLDVLADYSRCRGISPETEAWRNKPDPVPNITKCESIRAGEVRFPTEYRADSDLLVEQDPIGPT